MNQRSLNRWDVSPTKARQIQDELAPRVIREGDPQNVRFVAGIDAAMPPGGVRAAVVLESYPDLSVVETTTADSPLAFPYVPGLLSFREAPTILAAWAKVTIAPDVIIVDGQGIAHPRHLGIASHLGLILDLPTIGCAKSLLVGHGPPVGPERGDWSPLEYRGEIVGAAVRTKVRTNPVYVSIGHRISLEAAIQWTLACCRGYRLPNPQRAAHLAAGSR